MISYIVAGASAFSMTHASDEEPANPPYIVQVAEICEHNNAFPNNRIGDDCLRKLNAYFFDRPIWDVAGPLFYFVDVNIDTSAHAINRRSGYLSFNSADYLLDEVPLWSDIFDGSIQDRNDVVLGVFRDDVCRALAWSGGVQPALAERCQARELFKYATHLDACLTGFQRNMVLMKPQRSDGRSIYQNSIDEIVRQDRPSRDAQVAELAELHMHALWMTGICTSFPAMAFDDDLQPLQLGNLGNTDFTMAQFSKKMETGHNAAMGIAARSGDEWAMQSYYPPHPKRDPDYWQAMQRNNPLLLHRWMASVVGGVVLSDEERMWHAVKAYAIERETSTDLRLADYVLELKEGNIPLNEVLSDYTSLRGDSDMSLDDIAEGRIADDTLLKYPW